jgi:hypothetical protein
MIEEVHPMFLREENVNAILAGFLESKGFKITGRALGNSQGHDIVALSPQGRTLKIEVKGEGYGREWTQQTIYPKVTSAVFNQLRSAHANNRKGGTDVYGVAFPENKSYRIYLNTDMMDLLVGHRLLVFFVRRDGSVELCGNDALPA